MRKLLALVAVVGLVSTAACKKEEKAAETPPTEEPVVDEQPVVAEPVDDKPDMANKMEHCPSSVAGATTKVEGGEGVIIVTVTAADEAATTEIRTRAGYLAGLERDADDEVKHSGEGTGGGALGKCPVVVAHATLAVEDVERGSKITMTPTKEGGLAELNALATERAAALATGATMHGADDGHGHGGHGGGTGGGTGGGKAGKPGIDAGK